MTATSSDTGARQIRRVDGTVVIIHLLKQLQRLGVENVVITLGHKGSVLASAIQAQHFDRMRVHLVWCDSTYCRGHASNLTAARSFFTANSEPILVVMADHLYEDRLLDRFASSARLDSTCDAVALVDDSSETVKWVANEHCDAFCKNGHCQKIVKVLRGESGRLVRIGKRLTAYDGLEGGAYVVLPAVFEILAKMLSKTVYCTLADAMQQVADSGRLRYISTEGRAWYSELTVSSLQQPDFVSKAVRPQWRADAKRMLASTHGCLAQLQAQLQASSPETAEPLTPSRIGGGEGGEGGMKRVCTMLQLGEAIGEGASSVVCEATEHPSSERAQHGGGGGGDGGHEPSPSGTGGGRSGASVAVKMVRHSDHEHEQLANWETHVLQQLRHPHISKLRDVIELVDATYIVMEKVDGPELGDFIASQPGGRLPPEVALRFLCQLLSALRHAHDHGFLHCDIKPANIRLSYDCRDAVLTDWGFAREVGSSPCAASLFGTPAYAPPEQLTGYCPDGIVGGARKLCPAADVWALGATLHEMLVGTPPFRGDTFDQLVRNAIQLNYTESFADDVPPEARELVLGMLQVSPCDRMTLAELIGSPWVSRSGLMPHEPLAEHQVGISCEPCQDDDDPKVHGRRLRDGCRPWGDAWRGTLLRLLYGSLVVGAVLSHVAGGGSGTAAVFEIVEGG